MTGASTGSVPPESPVPAPRGTKATRSAACTASRRRSRPRHAARVECAPVTAIPGEFAPPARLLLGPGPSEVHPRVLRAMSAPLVGHLDPAFIAMMEDVKALLRFVFAT